MRLLIQESDNGIRVLIQQHAGIRREINKSCAGDENPGDKRTKKKKVEETEKEVMCKHGAGVASWKRTCGNYGIRGWRKKLEPRGIEFVLPQDKAFRERKKKGGGW